MTSYQKAPSSFRDTDGFVFFKGRQIYRQINLPYQEHYDYLMASGLYKQVVDAGLLIPHNEVKHVGYEHAYKIIQPELIPFISYPYEWCFSQLKVAALTTLTIQKIALDFGMSLKDCSAYNIQFTKGKPVLIDTLSFEKYREGLPWVAYRQFCQHFLAPLILMSYTDIRLNRLLQLFIDGIPLDLTSSLLPFRTKFMFSMLSHIHLHAKSQKYFADKAVNTKSYKMNRRSLYALIDSLESAVRRLNWHPRGTEWAKYYENTNYSVDALKHKAHIVTKYLDRIKPNNVWDLGANAGTFSQIASQNGAHTVSFDIDPAAVEKNYLACVKRGEKLVLPLFLDLTNPSPSIGWDNEERMSFIKRGPVDMVFALALIHHLAISNNLPFGRIAQFFSEICSSLVIEFVPKHDSQVQKLLRTREDIFSDYSREMFEIEFSKLFSIQDSEQIKNSERIVYLMIRKEKSF
jgi:hypothetical protein